MKRKQKRLEMKRVREHRWKKPIQTVDTQKKEMQKEELQKEEMQKEELENEQIQEISKEGRWQKMFNEVVAESLSLIASQPAQKIANPYIQPSFYLSDNHAVYSMAIDTQNLRADVRLLNSNKISIEIAYNGHNSILSCSYQLATKNCIHKEIIDLKQNISVPLREILGDDLYGVYRICLVNDIEGKILRHLHVRY